MGPGKLTKILWKLASRTPLSLISVLVFGRPTSEMYARIPFFRDVAGWYEDKYPIQMGSAGKDPHDPTKHTQTVERSHSTVKMRLRLGRRLQSPAHVFKKLGDAAYDYVTTPNCDAKRISNLTYKLANLFNFLYFQTHSLFL